MKGLKFCATLPLCGALMSGAVGGGVWLPGELCVAVARWIRKKSKDEEVA